MTDSLEAAVPETKAVTQSEEFEALRGLKRQFHCGTSSEYIRVLVSLVVFPNTCCLVLMTEKTKLSTVGNPGQNQTESV